MGLMNAGGASLVWPLLVQVALTLAVLGVLGRRRFRALGARDVRAKEVALSNDAWPETVKQASNNFSNQFEIPVLFYVLVITAIHVGATGPVMTVLAGILRGEPRRPRLREHISRNNVNRRFAIFAGGVLVLVAMLVGVLVAAL
ncbi:MAG: MAPEG family protein [Piscinibacter sp.]